MSYMYGLRGTCKETPLTAAIRSELYAQPYSSIDWNAARNLIAKEDLYYPHPLVQDVLWWSLYQAEGLLKGSRLRRAALAECMKHIHYEVGVGSNCRAGEDCRGWWGICLPANMHTVEGLHQAEDRSGAWCMMCCRCLCFIHDRASGCSASAGILTVHLLGSLLAWQLLSCCLCSSRVKNVPSSNLLPPAAGREHALRLHWTCEQGAQHAVLLV